MKFFVFIFFKILLRISNNAVDEYSTINNSIANIVRADNRPGSCLKGSGIGANRYSLDKNVALYNLVCATILEANLKVDLDALSS